MRKSKLTVGNVTFVGLVLVLLLVTWIGSEVDLLIGMIGLWLFGICMLVIAYFMKRQAEKKTSLCTVWAEGIVVDVWEGLDAIPGENSYHKSQMWKIKYQYCANGQYIVNSSPETIGNSPFQKGQKLNVYYNPNNIYDCIVMEMHSNQSYQTFLRFGSIFMICAVLAAVLSFVA